MNQLNKMRREWNRQIQSEAERIIAEKQKREREL